MSWVAVCTDSSALVPEEVASRPEVCVVAVPVAVDGEPVDDDRDLDGFYHRLEGGARATTSRPSPGDFLDAYRRAAARGATEILSIHLDRRASGTMESAELAARAAPVPVRVVDTGTVSFGVGVCVRAAVELLEAGATSGEAEQGTRRLGAAMANAFVAPASAGGRVGGPHQWAVLTFAGGTADVLADAGTQEDATAVMARLVASAPGALRVAVGYAAASVETAAAQLARALGALERVVGLERYRVGPAVGAHTGPLGFGAFWWPAGHEEPGSSRRPPTSP